MDARVIEQRLATAFASIERAAAAGARCPENGTAGVGHGVVPALARAGKIRVEIFAHNFRRVTILAGPQAGQATAPPPTQCGPAWKVIDAGGTWKRGRPELRRTRRVPVTLPKINLPEVC